MNMLTILQNLTNPAPSHQFVMSLGPAPLLSAFRLCIVPLIEDRREYSPCLIYDYQRFWNRYRLLRQRPRFMDF